MNNKQRRWLPLLLAIALLAGCGDDDPARTLLGTWDLVGFTEHGVETTVTGSASFGEGGDFEFAGEVTFPGEPADEIGMSGAWRQIGDRLTLTTLTDSEEWIVRFAGDEATLTLVGDEPTNVITLCCRAPAGE
jgi:hypothetical protein